MKLSSDDPYPNEKETYTCEKCGEKFRLQSTMDRHICDEHLLPFTNVEKTLNSK